MKCFKGFSLIQVLIAAFFLFCLAPARPHAAEIVTQKTTTGATSGTVTQQVTEYGNGRDQLGAIQVVTLSWKANNSGSVKQALRGFAGELVRIMYTADTTSAPTSTITMTCKDNDKYDSFSGRGTIATSVKQLTWFPAVSDGHTSIPLTISGTHDFQILNAGARRQGVTRLWLKR